jgi:cobalt-precorrin-5B (C1)-methyltransferase
MAMKAGPERTADAAATAGPRGGLTTGTCAAAAAKAAALALAGAPCHAVDVELPGGDVVTLAVEWTERPRPGCARAAVVKDAGDDPDVTNGMTVVVEVEVLASADAAASDAAELDGVFFAAGPGVGTVTRAGLQVPPGEPAINPVPRRMIADAVREALPEGAVRVTVSIPGGEETARRTFNPRLGIEGGLSVLGTSGRVVPKSEDAWLRSLLPQVDMALAEGETTLYLAPGTFGERAAREQLGAPETAIVQCSNFAGDLLDHCADKGVERVVLVGHAGKLVKIAAGIWNTHSRYGDARLETLAALAAAGGAPPTVVTKLLDLPTAEAAAGLLAEAGLEDVWDDVADRVVRRAAERVAKRAAGLPLCDCAIVAYDGAVLGRSAALRAAPAASPASSCPPALELTVVGVGPGADEWLTPAAWRVVHAAEVVAGGRRQLERFAPAGAERVVVGASMDDVAAALRERAGHRIVVLASGDPGFYGIAATLCRLLPEAAIVTLPGISAVQLAAARLGRPWNELLFASAHGLGVEGVAAALADRPHVAALSDARTPPQALAAAVLAAGLNAHVAVVERVGQPDELITAGDAAAIAGGEFDGLAVTFIDREEPA